MSNIEEKLTQLGLTLPAAALPAANYLPTQTSGNLLFVSGQLPMQDGKPQFIGKVGKDVSLDDAKACAKLCGLNILAHSKLALDGDLSRIKRLIRLGVFVNATDDYTDHPQVANGVSDLMVELMGDAGKHARFAVGVSGLPFGVAVEVDATFELA
ncbi:MAG: RidA family protein [Rickettsiales bacterium]|nr:RidA family protein [Rickettsiales bacterium]